MKLNSYRIYFYLNIMKVKNWIVKEFSEWIDKLLDLKNLNVEKRWSVKVPKLNVIAFYWTIFFFIFFFFRFLVSCFKSFENWTVNYLDNYFPFNCYAFNTRWWCFHFIYHGKCPLLIKSKRNCHRTTIYIH